MRLRLHLLLTVLVCASLAGCAAPGAPQPPSLELAYPVDDLAATRSGDKVVLTWTVPQQTTDAQNIRHPGPTRICRSLQPAMVSCAPAGELPPPPVSEQGRPVKMEYADTLPPELQRQNPAGFASYAVEVLNARGRSAGLSNQVRVPLAPTLPPPADLRAQVTADGILLTFTGELHQHEVPEMRHIYRVYRRAEKGPEVVAGEEQLATDAHARLLDHSFEWEQTYWYRVVAVTRVEGTTIEVEGESSPPIQVVARDVFPPAAPTGLQAVFSGVGQKPFIDLTWAPNLETDLAGYNVYRHEAGMPAVKINRELGKAPAFRDSDVAAGKRYFYAVTAVDLRGNESARSEEASEVVP
jgi:hypothetical protein